MASVPLESGFSRSAPALPTVSKRFCKRQGSKTRNGPSDRKLYESDPGPEGMDGSERSMRRSDTWAAGQTPWSSENACLREASQWTSEKQWKRLMHAAKSEKESVEHDLLGYLPVPTEEEDEDVDDDANDDGFQKVATAKGGQCQLRAVLDSVAFQGINMSAILLNAVIIGFETDMPELSCWAPIENAFLALFSFELALRMFVAGPTLFFCGGSGAGSGATEFAPTNSQDVKAARGATARRRPFDEQDTIRSILWNIFDFLIVSIGILSYIADKFELKQAGMAGDATLFRTFRLLRVLRILRVIRVVRFLKQLYLLAYGFMEGVMAVFWVAVMSTTIIYVCSILLVRFYGKPIEGAEHYEFFTNNFGSIPRAMVTLFNLLCSPTLLTFNDVIYSHPPLVCFLIVFIIFGSFGISGLLTGVITESIIDKNQARIEDQRVVRETKRRLLERRSMELFDELDTNGEGSLAISFLMLHTEDIAHLFSIVGVACPAYELEQLFSVMDPKDTGRAEKSQFVYSLVELCEEVRPMSIMELNAQMSKCTLRVEDCDRKVSQLTRCMDVDNHDPASASILPVPSTDENIRPTVITELSAQMSKCTSRVEDCDHKVNQLLRRMDAGNHTHASAPIMPVASTENKIASSLGEQHLFKLVGQIRSLTESRLRQGATLDLTRKVEYYELLMSKIEGLALDALLAVTQTGAAVQVMENSSFQPVDVAPVAYSMVQTVPDPVLAPIVSESVDAPIIETIEACRLTQHEQNATSNASESSPHPTIVLPAPEVASPTAPLMHPVPSPSTDSRSDSGSLGPKQPSQARCGLGQMSYQLDLTVVNHTLNAISERVALPRKLDQQSTVEHTLKSART